MPAYNILIILIFLTMLAACQGQPVQPENAPKAVATREKPEAQKPEGSDEKKPARESVLAPASNKSTASTSHSVITPLRSSSARPATAQPEKQAASASKGLYRHSDGTEMRYDPRLGVYDVINMKDMYFHRGHYLRFANAGWLVATQFDGPWLAASSKQIPKTLAISKAGNQTSRR